MKQGSFCGKLTLASLPVLPIADVFVLFNCPIVALSFKKRDSVQEICQELQLKVADTMRKAN